jgi:hypothetical protein
MEENLKMPGRFWVAMDYGGAIYENIEMLFSVLDALRNPIRKVVPMLRRDGDALFSLIACLNETVANAEPVGGSKAILGLLRQASPI